MKKRLPSDEAVLRSTGAEILACRRDRGFSQERLGDIARIFPRSVSVIERGSRDYRVLAISSLYLSLECAGVIVADEGFIPLRDNIEGARMRAEVSSLRDPSFLGMMGAAVRSARTVLGMTMAELSASAEMHLNSLYYFEKGLVVPSVCSYYRILRVLGVEQITVESGDASFHNK